MTDLQTFVINPFYCSFFVYWGLSFIFFLADISLDNKKYRIEPDINWKLYKKSLYHVLYLQFCYSLPIMYMLIPFWKWRNITIEYISSAKFRFIIYFTWIGFAIPPDIHSSPKLRTWF